MEHSLAQRLRRDGPGIDGCPAEDVLLLDDANPLAELRRLNGGLLPSGAGADDGDVEMSHGGFGLVGAEGSYAERGRDTNRVNCYARRCLSVRAKTRIASAWLRKGSG